MDTETRSRAYREGWVGRRRTYKCRQCTDEKFEMDTLNPLLKDKRVCPKCMRSNRIAIMVANDVGNWDSFKKGGDTVKV